MSHHDYFIGIKTRGNLDKAAPILGTCVQYQMYCNRCKDKSFLIECACGCGGVRALRNKRGEKRTILIGHRIRKDWCIRQGRYWLKRRDHPMADACGYVRRYWLIYEESRNCCLLAYAKVHHRDGNPLNDVWYNLRALWNGQHTTVERTGRHQFVPGSRQCVDCGSRTTHIRPDNGYPHWYRTGDGKYKCMKCYKRVYDAGLLRRRKTLMDAGA